MKLITLYFYQRHGFVPEINEPVRREGSSGSAPAVTAADMGQARLLFHDSRAGAATSIDPATAAAAVGGWGALSTSTGTEGKLHCRKSFVRCSCT
jgi:hypothetical protein